MEVTSFTSAKPDWKSCQDYISGVARKQCNNAYVVDSKERNNFKRQPITGCTWTSVNIIGILPQVLHFLGKTMSMFRPLRLGSLALSATCLLFLLLALAPAGKLHAQNTSAALTGTVADSTGAVIPNATVILKSESSGDTRRTVSNAEGYFTISAIQPGSYTVTVEASGFSKWEQKGVSFNSGDKRNLSDIALAVGATTETVEVTGVAQDITPVDSGEKSSVISEKQLQNVAILGS